MNIGTLDTNLLHSQNKILHMIATGKPLDDILISIALEIERIIPTTYCSICLINENNQTLEVWAAPRLPNSYNEYITGIKIGRFVGSCGTAAYLKERIIAEDIDTDPLWQNYKERPLNLGLRSCWSQPILSSDKRALGTFGLYYNEPKQPTEMELHILGTFTDLASIAVEYKQTNERLENKERQYRLLAENISDFVGIVDEQGICLYVSPSHEKFLGYAASDLTGKKWFDYVHPEDLSIVKNSFSNMMLKEERAIFRFQHKQGHWLYLDGIAAPIIEEKLNRGQFVYRARDITEKTLTKQRLEETQLKFESLFHHSLDAIFEMDSVGNFMSINGKAELLSGYKSKELLKMNFKDMIEPSRLENAQLIFPQILQGRAQREESVIVRKDGQHINIDINVIPLLKSKNKTHVLAFVQDITAKKRAENEVRKMAFTDSLTGLPNRTDFTHKLDKAIQRSKERQQALGIMFIDFDNFKSVNDTLGHHIGDQVLIELASLMKKSLPEEVVISRQGGDEFLLMVERTTREQIGIICEQLINKFNTNPIEINNNEILITPSIGACLYPDFGTSAATLIKNSDLAMYAAKEKGKNNYLFYSEDLNDKMVRKNLINNALRNALKRNEFTINYQPLFDLSTHKIKGIEALLRWKPEFGFVSPAEFIPIAEETGVIIEIGEWVLKEACRQMKIWMENGLISTPISVNVSPRQFQEPSFLEKVTNIINEINIPASMLEIEITERVMIDVTEAVEIVNKLRKLGVKISIDDFGVGYSSLSMLNSIEIDTLKIDQSFLHDVMKNEKSARLLEAIIRMGEELFSKVVVEGIETDEQADFLKHRGVIGQGYYYSRPLPVNELESFIKEKS